MPGCIRRVSVANRTGVVVVAMEDADQVAGVASVPVGKVDTEDHAPDHRQEKAGRHQQDDQGAAILHGSVL